MAQDYDKIIKENLQESIPDFIETFLGIHIPATEEVPLELQRTLERRPDFLKKIRFDDPEKDFILQVEAQSADDEMRFRFMVYKGLLIEREHCPVVQVVLYFGEKPPTMPTEYTDATMSSRFLLLNFREIPYRKLLEMKKPGEIIFALLGDWGDKTPEVVVDEIVDRLANLALGELQLKKYAVQLRVISKLRNLQLVISKMLNRMPLVFDVTDDLLFKKGLEKGIEQGLEQGLERGLEQGLERGLEKGLEKGQRLAKYGFVANLLADGGFDHPQIMRIADVPADFVKKVERELARQSDVLLLLKPRAKNETVAGKAGVSLEFVEYLRQSIKKRRKN